MNPDPRMQFFRDAIKTVPYFAKIDEQCLFDIMFKLEPNSYEKGDTVLSTE